MLPIPIAFGDISKYPGENEDYIRLILLAVHKANTGSDYISLKVKYAIQEAARATADEIIRSGGTMPKPTMLTYLQAKSYLAQADPSTLSKLQKKMECFLTTIDPLLNAVEGEVPADEMEGKQGYFTFLQKRYADYPRGTIVFVRRTNYAEYFLMLPSWKIQDPAATTSDALEVVPPRIMSHEVEQIGRKAFPHDGAIASASGTAKSIAKTVLRDVAEGFLGSIVGTLGTVLLDLIFPDNSVPAYFDEVYEEIKQIVGASIQQNTITELTGLLDGVSNSVSIDYANQKGAGKTNTELYRYLENNVGVNDFQEEVVAVLKRFHNSAGFSVWMVAATLHIALLQEMCIQDPSASSPSKSANAQSIKAYAGNYVSYVESTWPTLLQQRKDKVIIESYTEVRSKPGPHYPITYIVYGARWHDTMNDKYGPKRDDYEKDKKKYYGSDTAKKDRDSYFSSTLVPEFTKYCRYPSETAAKWKKLKTDPVRP